MKSLFRRAASLLACSLAALAPLPATPTQAAEPSGEDLLALVRDYSALGDHRTGTPAEAATVDWFADQLGRRGARVQLQSYSFDRYDARAEVLVDGRPVPALPLYYEAAGDVSDDKPYVASVATLEGEAGSAALDETIARARAAGARSVVIATLNPAGELQAPNRAVKSPGGLPVVLVPGRLAEDLTHKPVTLKFSAHLAQATARNVIASFGDTSRMPLVIATPLSCWFTCAGERGTGIALALALAEHMAPRHPVLVIGTTGHEVLPHVGQQVVLGGRTLQAGLLLHLGANVALANDEGTGPGGKGAIGLRMSPLMMQRLKPALETLGGRLLVPNPKHWLGEGELWAQAVQGPMISLVAAGPRFHTPADAMPQGISAPVLQKTYAGLAAALDAWMQAVPADILSRVKPQVTLVPESEIDAHPTGDCFWLAAVSPQGFNLQYPDDGVTYWGTQYRLPVGARLELHGRFPHARHMSINAYDSSGSPLDRIVDHLLQPDQGSTNPFVAGARRNLAERSWHVKVEPRELVAGQPLKDDERAPDTLYVPNNEALTELVYRVYLPDSGRDATGDAGLPRPVLTLADGHRIDGEALCRAIVVKAGSVRDPHVPAEQIKPLFNLPSRAPYHPAQPQPHWNAFFNPTLGIASLFIGTPWEAIRSKLDATKRGGFYGTLDNTYLSLYVDSRYDDVLVLRGKAPTTPRTQHGDPVMDKGDLRYWSFCKYRSLADTAVDSCVNDEQVPRDAAGRYTVVVSPPDKRPSNARPECGFAWLPWGVGDNMGNPHGGFLLMRQMMPSDAFRPSSAFAVKAPGEEKPTLGDYYPEPSYMSRADFEKLGCRR